MELELTADPQIATDLSRMKAFTGSRDGRPRTVAIKIVWHDSPEHALLADGLTLAEQRGTRRLERVFPGAETWLPAQPVPIVTEAPDNTMLPAPLAPIAAFEGRQTTSVHQFNDQAVTVTILRGSLRAVTAQRAASRILLSGEEQAVRAAAVLISEAGPVSAPIAALAADGIALATGGCTTARHTGAPALPAGTLQVRDALMHTLGHLIDVILAQAPVAARRGGDGPEAVHQMRVAVRRARSALSIFQDAVPEGALDDISARLKELGSRLGPTRDWDVFADETLPAIQQALPHDQRLGQLVTAAARRQLACQKALASYLDSAAFRMLGIELAWFVAAQFWHEPQVIPNEAVHEVPSLTSFAATVLQHRWKKLISSGKRIEELDVASLHGVRLRAKRARYAAEMFSTLHHGKSAHRFVRRLSVLQQRLGALNDGAVASHLLAELGGVTGRHAYASGLVIGFLAARAAEIRPRIIQAFEKFRRQPVYWT